MNLDQFLDSLKEDRGFMQCVSNWQVLPPREARYAPWPEGMDERIREALLKRGIRQLYTHQVESLEKVSKGEDVVVVTPTASGKTMCYNLPVLSAILKNNDARALYLFPS